MYYLADDAPTVKPVDPKLAKTWMIILGVTIGVGFLWGHIAERKLYRR